MKLRRPFLLYVNIAIILASYILMAGVVFSFQEPWWAHEVRRIPDVPKPEHAKLVKVSAGGGADFRTISEAVGAASPGDRIIVYPGVYRESDHVEGKPWLTIEGVDRDRVASSIWRPCSDHRTARETLAWSITMRYYLLALFAP